MSGSTDRKQTVHALTHRKADALARIAHALSGGDIDPTSQRCARLYLRFEAVARLDDVVAARPLGGAPCQHITGTLPPPSQSSEVALFLSWQAASIHQGTSDAVLVFPRAEAQALAGLCSARGLCLVDNAQLRGRRSTP